MVHWPEVMVSYESSEKVLFSADGFGRFGAVAKFDEKADWASEARRYYLNIVGKYGPQVQALLKKAAALDIKTICPLHGPVLTGDLSKYLNYYDLWSSYKAEEPEKILVASAPSTATPVPLPTPWLKSCVHRAQRWWRWI